MTPASVDANVLLRAILAQDPDQTARAQALLEYDDAVFLVSDAAIIEFVFVLAHHYGLSRSQIAEMTSELLTINSLECRNDVILAAIGHFEQHPQLSFEDCLMAEQATASAALPLYTFDLKLARQHPAARLVPPLPQEHTGATA